MASTDATPVPIKNQAYRVTFPILDADGDLVTGATSPDSEVSKDGGTFTDCTNEATEIATSSGMYYLDLTSTEMNADTVAIIVKTATAGAKTTPIVLYPVETGDIPVNVTAYGGTAGTFTSGKPTVLVTSGTGTGQLSITSGVVAASLSSSERNSAADAILDRDMSTGADSGSTTVRTVRQALRFLRNKWSLSGTTLTVCKEDDTTASWTSTVTTNASADPITANDPAGP